MSGVLELLKDKEKIFVDMIDYINDTHFKYDETDVESYVSFVNNISVYVRALKKLQDDIDAFDTDQYSSDTEVRTMEQRCKMLAKQACEINKGINDKMTVVLKEIGQKYNASKNQQKFYGYNNNANFISESFASFDMKQ